jgi:Nif-specific regulatory protein
VTAGPARGRTATLDGHVSVGRDVENALSIADPALSRKHCVIEARDSTFVIRDLGSRNGVFINGAPVTERQLADGDQIRIGDSALVVMIPGNHHAAPPNLVAVDERQADSSSTVAIDEVRQDYARLDRGDPAAKAGDLSLLLRVSEGLQRATTIDELAAVLLPNANAAVGAAAAALLVRSDEGAWRADSAEPAAAAGLAVHGMLATRSSTGRIAVLSADATAIYAPMGDETVLWMAAPQGQRFIAAHLHIAASIGSIAALALERVRHLQWLHDQHARLRHAAIKHDLIGEGRAMQHILRFIERVASTDATVLLGGESGTGKELVAKAIHANSVRSHGPFVAINCAALPEALLESELFGHERGAFTGALAQQRGRLEIASGGTVFLDEIGELASALQAKLLRVLQERVIERVGGRRPIPLDIRVVAATNRDLEKAIATGSFRQDLFYRLNVVSLTVPPLRDRREDLPLLAAYFVREHAERCKRTVRGISPAARAMLMRYDWPGNIRELSNAIERAVVLGSSDVITPDDLPETLHDLAMDESVHGFHGKVTAARRTIIREALERNHHNVAAAARELDLQVTYLHRLIRNLNLRTPPC